MNAVVILLFVVAPLAWLGLWTVVIGALCRRGGRRAVVGAVISLLVAVAVPSWAVLLFLSSED